MDYNEHTSYKTEDQLFILGLIGGGIAGISCLIYPHILRPYIPFESCIWDQLFHIYCPGCGGTRAIEALFKGKILRSIWLHPLVPYSALLYALFMGSNIISRFSGRRIAGLRFHNWYLYAALIIIIVNWLLKNILRRVFFVFL